MIWQDIAIIVSSIIVSVGGAGGIIVAISKWVGGIIANNIIQKNQAKYDKELEEFKADYQKEIEEYKSQLNIACEAIKKKIVSPGGNGISTAANMERSKTPSSI